MSSPFAQTGNALLAAGYSPIPIVPGDKMPGHYGSAVWRPARNWSEFCETPAHPSLVEKWSGWPNAGVGVALGRDLVGIDIDNDEPAVREAIESVLPPCTVGKVGSRGVTYFFRGDTTKIKSRAFKIDGQGIVDVLAHGRQTVLPPSVHPKTGQPYRWLTGMQALEDVRLEDLNELPDDINDRIALVLVQFGHGQENGSGSGALAALAAPSSSTPVAAAGGADSLWRQLNNHALANLDAWVPALQLPKTRRQQGRWTAVADWRPSSSGRPIAQRNPNLSFHKTGICDHGDGGKGYTPINAVMAARGTDRDEAAAWLHDLTGFSPPAGEPTPPLTPTYASKRIPVVDARRRLREAVTQFEGGPFAKWRVEYGAYELDRYNYGAAAEMPQAECHLIKSEAGAGKSRAVAEWSAPHIKRGACLHYYAPRHDLCEQVAEDFRDEGIGALAYRGYEAIDPTAPDHKMCRDLGAYRDARAAGVGVHGSVCRQVAADGSVKECPFYNECGMMRQRHANPQLWVLPHDNLLHPLPEFITRPWARIIDEGFVSKAITRPDHAAVLSLDQIERHYRAPFSSLIAKSGSPDTFAGPRGVLLAALRGQEDGHLTRAALIAAGMSADEAEHQADLVRDLRQDAGISPAMDPAQRSRAAERVCEVNHVVGALGAMWSEIAEFLRGPHDACGRMRVLYDAKRKARVVEHRPLRRMHESGYSATLLIDATPLPTELLEPIVGMPVTMTADLAVEWSPYCRSRFIPHSPTSATKLGFGRQKNYQRKDGKDPLVYENLRRIINMRAVSVLSQADPRVLVVGQQKPIDVLRSGRLLDGVEYKHFNALTGLNEYKRAAGVVVFGRPLLALEDLEAAADVLAGYPIPRAGNYTLTRGGVAVADGSVAEVYWQTHPHPVAEALRWLACEGELIQAIARIRPLDRGADAPAFVDIISDVPPPFVVDEVMPWRDACVAAGWADMIPQGVVYTAALDIAAALGVTKKQAEPVLNAAREAGFQPLFALENPIEKRGRNPVVRYQQAGAGKKPQIAYILPNGPQTRGEIKRRIRSDLAATGEIAWFSFDPPPGMAALPVDVTLARIGRQEGTIVSRLSEIGAWAAADAEAT